MSGPAAGLRRSLSAPVLEGAADLAAYAYDGAHERRAPDAVVLARTAEDVRRTVAWCADAGVPYVARGAGTNLCGGAVARKGGVVIAMAGLNRILALDTAARTAVVEPGVVNLHLQNAAEPLGLFYAPDPASYKVCTLGGNLGENAGGPRCFKYGTTTHHVRAVEAAMPDGTLERFSLDDAGPELMSLLVGSEGTLGVVTKAWLNLVRVPEAVVAVLADFDSLDAAMGCVAGLVAAGVAPRVLEAMDRRRWTRSRLTSRRATPGRGRALDRGQAPRPSSATSRPCASSAGRTARGVPPGARPPSDRLWRAGVGSRGAGAPGPQRPGRIGVVPRDRRPSRPALEGRRWPRRDALPVFHAGDGNLPEHRLRRADASRPRRFTPPAATSCACA